MQDVFLEYIDLNSTVKLDACDKKINANYKLADEFFLKNKGYYDFQGNVYLIEKEGLYQFKNADGLVSQYCLFKNDVKTLMMSLFNCFDYQGEISSVARFEILDNRLSFGKEKFLPPTTILNNLLARLAIPIRQISLYSACLKNSCLEFVELWDDVQKSWGVYSVDSAEFLGSTSKIFPSWQLLDDFVAGSCSKEVLAHKFVKNSKIFTDEINDKINSAIENSLSLQEFIEEQKAFFVYRLDGTMVLKVCAQEKYKDFLSEKLINLHENVDILYGVTFLNNQDLLARSYDEKIYISPTKATRTF